MRTSVLQLLIATCCCTDVLDVSHILFEGWPANADSRLKPRRTTLLVVLLVCPCKFAPAIQQAALPGLATPYTKLTAATICFILFLYFIIIIHMHLIILLSCDNKSHHYHHYHHYYCYHHHYYHCCYKYQHDCTPGSPDRACLSPH